MSELHAARLPSITDATVGQSLAHHVLAVQDGLSRLLGRSATTLTLSGDGDLASIGGQQPFDLLLAPDPSAPAITGLAQRLLRESKQTRVAAILKIAPDEQSEFKFVRPLELDSSVEPVCFVSNGVWYLGNQVGAFERHIANLQKTHFIGEGLVASVFRPRDGNWARSAAEYRNEIDVLSDSPAGFETPRLLASSAEYEPFWLVREKIDGHSLTELISAGENFDDQRVIGDVLADLVALERGRVYHDALRRHNVILSNNGKARLIDYGSISRRRVDRSFPSDLFLALLAFVRQISGRVQTDFPDLPSRSRGMLLDVAALPHPYRRTFELFFSKPPSEWSFAGFKQLFDAECGHKAGSPSSMQGVYLLAETLRQAVEAQHIDHENARIAAGQENAQWQAKADDLQNRLRATEAELVAVRETLSWKVTAPLRILKTGAKAMLSGCCGLIGKVKRQG